MNGKDYLLETPKMGAVPQRILKASLTSLASEHAQITGAPLFFGRLFSRAA